ncbi:MAG: XRE family transcriptional regulator [Chitinophagaceae bacterium]|jgi:transcriptional regulator with XRE-family HTH domain|nr:XRE family transcriptional regulator [Chitinophagaceae bacterium]
MKEDILIQISNKLREVRKSKSITLQELAEKAGVTRSLLSQVENSRTVPSLLVLINLIKALDLDLNVFFSDIDLNPPEEQVIVRQSHQYQPFEKEDAVGFGYRRILSTQLHSVHLDVVLLTLQPGAHRLPIATDAFELKYILEGTIRYHIGSKEYLVQAGDTLFFDGRELHVPANTGNTPATMLVLYFFEEK